MSKKENCVSVILSYLKEQNRPYSAQDVFCNLQKQHGLGKTVVLKALEQLAVEEKIKEKTYGKQKIYFADQGQFSEVSDSHLTSMDEGISELSARVQSVCRSCRQLDAELKDLSGAMTTQEVTSQIQELKDECHRFRERLRNIKTATQHITPEEKEKVYREQSVYVKEWRKRKRMASDMINSILEGYPKSKKHFLEEVGVETDEDCKVLAPST